MLSNKTNLVSDFTESVNLALENNPQETINALLDLGGTISMNFLNSLMKIAVEKNLLTVARKLINKVVDVTSDFTSRGKSINLIYIAASYGYVPMIKLLIAAGADTTDDHIQKLIVVANFFGYAKDHDKWQAIEILQAYKQVNSNLPDKDFFFTDPISSKNFRQQLNRHTKQFNNHLQKAKFRNILIDVIAKEINELPKDEQKNILSIAYNHDLFRYCNLAKNLLRRIVAEPESDGQKRLREMSEQLDKEVNHTPIKRAPDSP